MHRIALPACLLLASPALAADTIPGPVEARVLRVIDGDSVLADVTAHDGRRVANAMIARAHAQPYAGGRRIAFCR
jgi:endonuclease YncB( thermonuclease family)